MLADFQPVVQAAAHEAGALERAGAAANDEQRMVGWPQSLHQPLIAVVAQHRAADLRMAEVAEPQVDIRLALVDLAQLTGLHHQMLHRAIADQLLPAARLAVVGEPGLWLLHRLDQPDLLGDLVSALRDHLILGDHRYRGTGNRIQMYHVAPAAGTDLELRIGRLAQILFDEIEQLFLGNAQQQDRLAVLENAYAGDFAGRIHADQRHHRLARIGRDIDDVGGQEHIAEQLFLPVDRGVAFDIGRLAFALGKAGSAGQHIGTADELAHGRIGFQPFRQWRFIRQGLRQGGEQQTQQQR